MTHATHRATRPSALLPVVQALIKPQHHKAVHKLYRNIFKTLSLILAISCISTPAQARGYAGVGQCGPYPKLAISSPAGTCVGLVADEAHGLGYPRRVLEVAPGRLWVLDMGVSWVPNQGKLIELRLPPDAATPTNANTTAKLVEAKVLLTKLDRPSGLARGADGLMYVGEAGKVWRAAVPPLGQAPKPEVLLDDLPSDGSHPLKEITAAPDGSFYINMGSASDACSVNNTYPMPCPERSGKLERAAVWRLTVNPMGNGQPAVQQFKPFAHGLRNAMALAVMPDGPAAGSVWQGENGIDYADAKQPPEELNLLQAGQDYGWPYCHGQQEATRGYGKRYDCRQTQAPHMLWPAHAAPLHMIATPVNSPFQGQLLVAWHSQKPAGQRVVGFVRNAQGQPSGKPIEWLSGWNEVKGKRPGGRPTGLALDHAGRLLVVEDFNRSLLMLMPESKPTK